ncbi:hypothetical protein O181_039333 [Austropuccinia psidii MF-1]|uniref:Uncharacterized protein n=1 Tax=Austropuccinia psidii MF-1 TaxID=1389203 RepID=A0A9Q3DF57_9BASI|nr:hypothetical protein [Austropuccinia psidii MF-1]
MLKATGNNNNLVVGKMDGTLHPDSVEVVDEPQLTEVVEAEALDEVIGPRHPTLISGDINQKNILRYSRRPRTLLTKTADVQKTFRSALKGPLSDEWSKAIEKELGAMVDLNVWDVVRMSL